MSNDEDKVFTASGEGCESTFGTYEEAFDNLTMSDSWGQILKHVPYSLDDEVYPEEEVVYEHLPHLKP